MSDPNNYAEPKAADKIASIKKDVDGDRAGNTSNVNFTPEYAILLDDGVTLSDEIVVDSNRKDLADGFDVSDGMAIQALPTAFRAIGGDVITFRPGTGSKRRDVVGGIGGFGGSRERMYAGYMEVS